MTPRRPRLYTQRRQNKKPRISGGSRLHAIDMSVLKCEDRSRDKNSSSSGQESSSHEDSSNSILGLLNATQVGKINAVRSKRISMSKSTSQAMRRRARLHVSESTRAPTTLRCEQLQHRSAMASKCGYCGGQQIWPNRQQIHSHLRCTPNSHPKTQGRQMILNISRIFLGFSRFL